ncbi:MAG: hypothetical protein IPJ38_01675 [Dechloromonas sp.]|uniref:LapD/MoxY periplasmic domain-containing protein n=1 Tax=Candidatus Dechloromonas phosphorivorans TaxID=2899244 RepID=A0A935MUR7_9RHOO|nr:hypothetical protein [Candidatus Dechloromonas phosphorivorans]
MSLFRQLWLAVIASTLIAFTGSLLVSMVTARQYLEQQLAIKNNDNAASLALSMSQLAKDPITIELQVAAVFDSGQYASVQVIDPEGKGDDRTQQPTQCRQCTGLVYARIPN